MNWQKKQEVSKGPGRLPDTTSSTDFMEMKTGMDRWEQEIRTRGMGFQRKKFNLLEKSKYLMFLK